MKHIHYLFIILFLLSYIIKSALFLFGSKDSFLSYKKKTILPETLFAVGFLVTGIIMFVGKLKFDGWIQANTWMHIKLTLVVLAIPLGIVGFKKENKILVAVSALFFIYILLLALPQTRNLVYFF